MGFLAHMEAAPIATDDVAIWSKSSKAWGSARRIQRNYYAFQVTMNMTEGAMECPSCQGPLDLTIEVDRAIPALDYRPGNVCYLCRGCNGGRGELQSIRPTPLDWPHVDRYIADVRRASIGVAIPSVSDARLWWSDRPAHRPVSRYA